MKKHIIGFLIGIILFMCIMILCWIIGSLINADTNIINWGENDRWVFFGISGYISLFLIGALTSIGLETKK